MRWLLRNDTAALIVLLDVVATAAAGGLAWAVGSADGGHLTTREWEEALRRAFRRIVVAMLIVLAAVSAAELRSRSAGVTVHARGAAPTPDPGWGVSSLPLAAQAPLSAAFGAGDPYARSGRGGQRAAGTLPRP